MCETHVLEGSDGFAENVNDDSAQDSQTMMEEHARDKRVVSVR